MIRRALRTIALGFAAASLANCGSDPPTPGPPAQMCDPQIEQSKLGAHASAMGQQLNVGLTLNQSFDEGRLVEVTATNTSGAELVSFRLSDPITVILVFKIPIAVYDYGTDGGVDFGLQQDTPVEQVSFTFNGTLADPSCMFSKDFQLAIYPDGRVDVTP
jgi:hypothetical protein